MGDLLTAEERAFVERMKKTPLKDIGRSEACMMIDIIHRLAPLPEAIEASDAPAADFTERRCERFTSDQVAR